jgi:hypothetical protein
MRCCGTGSSVGVRHFGVGHWGTSGSLERVGNIFNGQTFDLWVAANLRNGDLHIEVALQGLHVCHRGGGIHEAGGDRKSRSSGATTFGEAFRRSKSINDGHVDGNSLPDGD